MTTARTPQLTAIEQAQLDHYEAAAYSEDSLRERMARAIAEADGHDFDYLADRLDAKADTYRRMADAALAVVRTPVEVDHA